METSEHLKNNISLIGLDLDNTLYPSTPEIQVRIRGKIYQRLSDELGIEFERAKELFEENYDGNYAWSHSGSRTIKYLSEMHDVEIQSDIVQEALETANILDLIHPNPELVSMLERLDKRYGLDLVTGSRPGIARDKLDKIGIGFGLFGYFLANVGSKSTGEAYEIWLRERDVPASQVLYVGDNIKQDIEAPKRLGIHTCLVDKKDSRAEFNVSNILGLEKLLI